VSAPVPAPFIVGVARSGTTLLRMMLDAHPDLAIPPETGFLPEVAALTETGNALRQTFFRSLTSASTFEDAHLSPAHLSGALAEIEPFDVASGVRCFYRLYAARFGKRRWGDKTPLYAHHLDVIERVLPEARFIHLIRDGRDVTCSVRHLWFAPGRTIEAIALNWRQSVLRCRQLGQGVRHYMEVRYEALVREPWSTLPEICRFLELEYDPALQRYHERSAARLAEHRTRKNPDGSILITHAQRVHNQRFVMQPPTNERIGRWQTDLSPSEQSRFASAAGDLLAQLGYTS
jgi:Sulfotransferase family